MLRANAGATRSKQGQVPRAGSPSRSYEFSQTISYLSSLLLSQLVWRCLRMERVMGIEPIDDSRKISRLPVLGLESAVQV